MKCGFIGAGNMAYAIIKAFIEKKVIPSSDIFIFDKNLHRQNEVCGELGVTAVVSAAAVAETCEIVFLAVKPHILEEVLPEVSKTAKNYNPLFITMAAGKTLAYVQSLLDYDARIVRIMPNINALVSKSVTAFCGNQFVTNYDIAECTKLLSAIGTALQIEESKFAAFTAVAGCSPSFVLIFADCLATAGVKMGLGREEALSAALMAIQGTAESALTSKTHPRELSDRVCSPGGATIEGVVSLMASGFDTAVVNAAVAAYNKTIAL
ncbi:MAG: pyrroline-5-carboxylate reductase [Clostridiales bacterium]|jgi:pyrroline-5-carboxylate reductase|nr:pyrroline-5-carboxylate reductase [Clostridiales bacterium]